MTEVWRAHRDGVLVEVHAVPGARRDEIVGRHGDALRVRVRAAPERGRANASIEAVLAEAFGVRPSDVRVERGATSRRKQVVVRTDDVARVAAAIVALSST